MSWNLFKTDRHRAEPLQLKNIILATISAALKKSEGYRRLPSATAPLSSSGRNCASARNRIIMNCGKRPWRLIRGEGREQIHISGRLVMMKTHRDKADIWLNEIRGILRMHVSAVNWTVLNSARIVCSVKERVGRMKSEQSGGSWRLWILLRSGVGQVWVLNTHTQTAAVWL